jgi:hypothetical protein
MNWNFVGVVASKRLLPTPTGNYRITVSSWYYNDIIEGSLRAHLEGAQKSVEIMEANEARDILLNLMEKGASLAARSVSASDVSFLKYWHDPSGQKQNHLSLVIGLDASTLKQISENLDQALLHQSQIQISCSAGFSAVEDNPQSKRPTAERFELGEVLPLHQPARVTLQARESEMK